MKRALVATSWRRLGALSPDQVEFLEELSDFRLSQHLENRTDENPTNTVDEKLRRRLMGDHRTAQAAAAITPETVVTLEDGTSASLMSIGVQRVWANISARVEAIQECEIEPRPRLRAANRIIRFLRPDIASERDRQISRAEEDYITRRHRVMQERNLQFDTLSNIIGDLIVNPEDTIVDEIPKQLLLEVAAAEDTTPPTGQLRLQGTLPTRLDRIASYAPPSDLGTATREPVQKDHVDSIAIREQANGVPLGPQEFVLSWLGDTPVQLPAERYADQIEIDVVRAMEPRLEEVSSNLDRNPINEVGLDKFDAIIDQIARCLAAGVMPWQTTTMKSIRRGSETKLRPEYDHAIFFNFDISPNSPRVYFVLEKETEGETRPIRRRVFIVAETDQHNQMTVFQRLTNASRKNLRAAGVGQQ